MQLGFVIDHSRCIGCHACTVACKSENAVPLGQFRTWVKYTETGEFPQVKRSFAVLRCNQCTSAPCVTICPVNALAKRPDGIVDVDPARCIGCKACMQGCPYDALYLNETSGTAEKCHFCAHRTEIGLAPACAVVCPTEAIVPGDFHDPESLVSRMKREHDLRGRKTEAGTGPNVLYREVSDAGIDPGQTGAAGGYLWAGRAPGMPLAAEKFLEEDAEARARTTYDVDHAPLWGWKITGYLFFKSLAAGVFLVLSLLFVILGSLPSGVLAAGSLKALVFLGITTALLVGDLKRPERFLYILIHPNWNSWLAKGSFLLVGFGGVLTAAVLVWFLGVSSGPVTGLLLGAGSILAAGSAAYTGWLFAQARGRVLWMQRGFWLQLLVQAVLGGAAVLLLGREMFGFPEASDSVLRVTLGAALLAYLGFKVLEPRLAPRARKKEFARAVRLVHRGPYAARHRWLSLGMGVLVPLIALAVPEAAWLWKLGAVCALAGLWNEEDILVRAGQALPLS